MMICSFLLFGCLEPLNNYVKIALFFQSLVYERNHPPNQSPCR